MEYIGNRVVPKHGGVWSSGKAYEPLTIVYEDGSGDSYISRKDVPAGTLLSQEEYWALCARFSEQMEIYQKSVDADVAALEKSVAEAESLTNSNKSTLNSRMDTLEAQVAANVSASTDSDADYAAEVVDARTLNDGTAMASLGEALRSADKYATVYNATAKNASGYAVEDDDGNLTITLSDIVEAGRYVISTTYAIQDGPEDVSYTPTALLVLPFRLADEIGAFTVQFLGTVTQAGDSWYWRSSNVLGVWSSWVRVTPDISDLSRAFLEHKYSFADGDDLDDFLEAGSYLNSTSSDTVRSISNLPDEVSGSQAFILIVHNPATTVALQTLYVYSNGAVYTRKLLNGSVSTDWYRSGMFSYNEDYMPDLDNMSCGASYYLSYSQMNDSGLDLPYLPIGSLASGDFYVYCFGYGPGNKIQMVIPRYNVNTLQKYNSIYWRISSGRSFEGQGWSVLNDGISYLGSINDYESLDDLDANTLSLYNSGNGVGNVPEDITAWIITLGSGLQSTGFRVQLFIGHTKPALYFRGFNTASGLTGGWQKLHQEEQSTIANEKAKMYSIGNSILTGSVWTDDSYDHLAAYQNSPYGCVADAIGIPEENETHVLISSTGILYDAGNDNFLTRIQGTDLSGYDVVLTHFWYTDIEKFDVGTVEDTGSDTCCGAVYQMLAKVRGDNPSGQLIVCAPFPVSTEDRGYTDTVFTRTRKNSVSYEEFDTLMESMAEKYRFIYISHQEFEPFYHWADFVDTNNVHACEEKTYRAMGAYLGARAARYVHF